MKVVVDSSVWVSHFGQEDQFTAKTKKFFVKVLGQKVKIVLPTIVIAETLVVLARQGHSDLDRISSFMAELGTVNLNLNLVQLLLQKLLERKTALKTSDFIIALTARQEKATLVTWDKQLLKRAKEICQVCTPDELFGKV